MDQCSYQLATRGHCIGGKKCHPTSFRNNKVCLFSFNAEPSSDKLKGAQIH